MQSRKRPLGANLLAGCLALMQFLFGVPLPSIVSSAQAQLPSPRVWISTISAEKDAVGGRLLAEKFNEAVQKRLKRSPVLELTSQGNIGPVVAGSADPRVEQAERLRVAGKESLKGGDADLARKQLEAALLRYEAGLPSVRKMEAVLEALGFLGVASIAGGYDADAKDYFKRVVTLAPDAQPLDEYPEKAKKLYEKVRKKLLKKKRGTLRISTPTKGALVKVDGIEVGKTPVTVRKLVRGYHYVQVEDADGALAAKRVKVKGGKSKRVKLVPSQEVGPAPIKPVDAGVEAALVGMARNYQVDATYRGLCEQIAKQTRARFVVEGHIAAEGNGFVFTGFIYGTDEKQVAAFDRFKFRADLASALVQSSKFVDALEEAVKEFPFHMVVVGGKVASRPLAPPKPVVEPRKRDPEPVKAPREVREEKRPASGANVVASSRPDRAPVDAWAKPKAVVDDTPPPEEEQWYQKWWVWTAASAVVVGAGVGTYLLVDPNAPNGRFDAEVRW